LLCFTVAMTMVVSSASAQITVASDSANNANYAPQPNGGWSGINGGFGFNLWTSIADQSGGGTYMEGVGVNNRQVDSNYSFAEYAGTGGYDISRPLSTSIASGSFSILTRFDAADSPGSTLVNLRAGNNTSSFSGGELLSFGIANGNTLSYTDSSGFHLMPSGEARGSVWDWNVVFNAGAGTYSLSVTNLGGGFADVVTGSLEAGGSSVGSFAVENTSTGNNQNNIFDLPTFAVPEPSTMVLGAAGLATLLLLRRRR